MVVGIIAGTGIVNGPSASVGRFLEHATDRIVETPFGPVRFFKGRVRGVEVALALRHGPGHIVPPHRVPYRAMVWALRKAGVTRAFGVSAVGGVNGAMKAGDLVVVDQLVDFTKCREYTFYDGCLEGDRVDPRTAPDAVVLGDGGTGAVRGGPRVVHVDMTDPYCPQMRSVLIEAASRISLGRHRVHVRGSYFASEGPRYETRGEIQVFRLLGADVVGMTGSPEAALCREAGICYSLLTVVANPAAGLSTGPLDHEDVTREVQGVLSMVEELLKEAVARVPADDTTCTCPAPLYRRTFDEYILSSGGDFY